MTKVRDFDAENMRLDGEAAVRRMDVTKAHNKRKREKFRKARRGRRQMRSAGLMCPRGEGP